VFIAPTVIARGSLPGAAIVAYPNVFAELSRPGIVDSMGVFDGLGVFRLERRIYGLGFVDSLGIVNRVGIGYRFRVLNGLGKFDSVG